MTNQEIVAQLANERIVEEIVYKIGANENPTDLEDLTQDIYIELLNKPNDTLNTLARSNQLNYYITRIVINNIRSANSRYYYIYKKDKQRFTTDYTENLGEYEDENYTDY